MAPKVLYRDAQGRTGEVVLDPAQPCYIGRALDCSVRTDDAMVSRKHSLIRAEDGRYVVEDLGSSNGTHVNDVRVAKQALAHNDVIRCGNLWLRFIDEPDAAAPQPVRDAGSSKYRTTLGGSGVQSAPPVRPETPAPASPAASPVAPAPPRNAALGAAPAPAVTPAAPAATPAPAAPAATPAP
ncbi:MAG: FHA domain-containing protein, partial [Deltaproteobacteria bacterium]